MKIVRDPIDGWYVLQESFDTRSTVEGERSEDENGHVMLMPEIEFDYDLPVQVEAPILQLEMDEFLANANEDGNSQEGGTLRHDDYYPDSNLFSLFNESDFNSDNDQSDRVKSPLYSTANRSTFDAEPLVDLTANFGTSQTVNVSVESIRGNQLVKNSSSDSDSSSSESFSSKSCSKLPSSKLPSSKLPSSESLSPDSSNSESEPDSDYNFSDSNVEYSSSSSDSSTVAQKRYRRKRLVKTAKRRKRVRQRRAAMTPEKLEKIRKAKRDYKRNRLARMSEQELQKHRERVREYDRLWRKKNPGKKAEYSRKNASLSKLPKKGELPLQKKKKNKKQRSQMSAEELEKLRKAQRDQKRNRLAQMTEQERQAHRQRVREYDRLWREKNPGKKAEYSRKVISNVVSQMSSEELEQRRRTQREKKRNQLAQMTEEERQKRRERIREYDRLWREKKKAEFARKNASSSKLPQKDELPLQKKKTENEKQQNGAIVDLFEARRERKNAQTRMRRRAALASETPEQREERLRKRREQARNRKEMMMLQAKVGQPKVGQPEVENHFLQMASMITSKQLTEHRNRKRKHRNGGNDPDYRPKLGDVHKRRQRPSMVDYSDSDD